MNLAQLRAALVELIGKMTALNGAAVDEKGAVRSFSDVESKQYSELEAQAVNLRDSIKRLEALEAHEQEARRLQAPASKTPNISITREEGCDESGQYRGFRSLGEQLQSVHRASLPGNRVDERLEKIRAASGLNETNLSEGGFLVQSDFMVDLQRDTYSSGTLASKCRRVALGPNSNTLEFIEIDESSRADGSRYGGVRAYWRAEAATVAASKPKLKTSRITVEDMMAICYVTDQALQDAPSLGSLVREAYAEEMAFVLDAAIVEGDGAGKPLGIKTAPCLITIAKESNQTNDTLVFANVSKMRQSMTRRGRQNAEWLINDELLPQLEALYVPLGTATGLPVFTPAGQFGTKQELLYSRPVTEVEACSALGDLGDIFFADLSEYLLVEKGTIDAQTSIHVRFEYGENCFRFTMRCNGRPRPSTALTPYKATSGAKRSPFVTLAAR